MAPSTSFDFGGLVDECHALVSLEEAHVVKWHGPGKVPEPGGGPLRYVSEESLVAGRLLTCSSKVLEGTS